MSNYLDLRNLSDDNDTLAGEVAKALDASRFLGHIPVAAAIHVDFNHNPHDERERYRAFISWNYINQNWMMSLTWHGIDNQGRPYTHYEGACAYTRIATIAQHLSIWKEIPQRVHKWIARHTRENVGV